MQITKVLGEISQCIAISYLTEIAMKADCMIGVIKESSHSKIIELKCSV